MFSSPNRAFGIVLGVIFIVGGILGFFITSVTPFTSTQGSTVIGLFEVNPLHTLIHLALGIVLLITGLVGPRTSRIANLLVGVIFAILGIFGFAVLANQSINIFAINGADDVLHWAAAVVLLAVAVGADRAAPKVKTA
jgi:Domain of unknown function (DUF4383)